MLSQEHGPHPCLLAHLVRPSFIFSMVRDPAARCLSAFYHFGVSCGNVTPTDEHKLAALRTCEDIQYRYTNSVCYTRSAVKPTAPAFAQVAAISL
jgi:hypothetical protein